MSTDNVYSNEVKHFNHLAQDGWDPNASMRPLHLLNPLRLAYIEQKVPLIGKQVLDVGCGVGLLSEAMTKAGAHVTGLDLSEQAIAVAKKHAKKHQYQIHYQNIALETFTQHHEKAFDVITCMEMLEHVPNPLSIIQHAEQCLRPDGMIFFSTLNRTLKSYLYSIIGAEYILRLLPIGTHRYAQFIRPSELCQWCQACGLKLKHIQGVGYQPLKQTFVLQKDVHVNYMLCVTRKVGFDDQDKSVDSKNT